MAEFDIDAAWERIWAEEVERRKQEDPAIHTWRVAGRSKATNPAGENLDHWRDVLGPQLFQWYREWRAENPQLEIADLGDQLGIEVDLNEQFDFSLLPFKGYVDRLFFDTSVGEHVVVDYKSGSRTPGNSVQLGFYRAGLVARYGLDVRYGAYYMARTASLTPYVDLTTWTPSFCGRILEMFHKAIQHGIFVPNITPQCRFCEVRRGCYAQGGDLSRLYDSLNPEYADG